MIKICSANHILFITADKSVNHSIHFLLCILYILGGDIFLIHNFTIIDIFLIAFKIKMFKHVEQNLCLQCICSHKLKMVFLIKWMDEPRVLINFSQPLEEIDYLGKIAVINLNLLPKFVVPGVE